jgi:hypothetical protein
MNAGSRDGPRAYMPFTQKCKKQAKEANALLHGGHTCCVLCNERTYPAQQSRRGVTPPNNETHVDHIIPRCQGGNGSLDNAQIYVVDAISPKKKVE